MGITVQGPGGVTIQFPDGTDATTIDRVMRQNFAGAQTPAGPAPSMAESLFRGAAEGATLGFGDEIGLLSRDRQEASRRANPWTHFAGEMVGTIAPAVVAPQVVGARIGTGILAQGARALARPFAAADMSTLPRAIGQGAKLGASFGLVSGAGHADPPADATWGQALTQRATGALTGGVLGGLLGGPAGAITYPFARVAQAVGGAKAASRAETADTSSGALTAFSRALERDRITPQALIDQIAADIPGSRSPRLQNPADLERLVARVGEGATQADLAREFGVAPQTAARLHQAVTENFATPLNLVDRTKLVRPGAGENTGWTLRAASATPGEPRATARERMVERQIGQGQRLTDAITRHIGTPEFDARKAQLVRDVTTQNEALYDAAHQVDAQMIALGNPLGTALQPVLDAHALRWVYSRGPVARAIQEAVAAFRPNVTGRAQQPISSLQQFMQAKQELQAIIDGSLQNRTVLRALQEFKNDLYDAVTRHNPAWRTANDAAADGFAAQRAIDLGMEFAGRLGPQTREHLTRYRAMSASEQELYRIGVAQKLHDRIMSRQETHDLTSELRLPGTRQALRAILGDREAAALLRRIDREFATTRTYREQFGSQTTPLREAIDDLSWAPRMESAMQLLSPSKIAEQAMLWIARHMNERRNQHLLTMMTDTDPIRQLGLLRSLGPLHQARSTAGRRTGTVGTGLFSAGLPNALLGTVADLQRQQPRGYP